MLSSTCLFHQINEKPKSLERLESITYSEPWQTLKMVRFPKVVDGFKPVNIFAKPSILDAWESFEYACENLIPYSSYMITKQVITDWIAAIFD